MSRLMPRDALHNVAKVSSFDFGSTNAMFTPWTGLPTHSSMRAEPETVDFETEKNRAYEEGFEAGRISLELEVATEREAMQALAAALETLKPEQPQALALVIAETVDRLVRQIVGSVGIDPELLKRRAECAAALVSNEVAPSRLRLHPEDVVLLETAQLPVEIAADPTLQRGQMVLDTAHGWIEDGPAVRLDRLRTQLDRLGAEA